MSPELFNKAYFNESHMYVLKTTDGQTHTHTQDYCNPLACAKDIWGAICIKIDTIAWFVK